MENNKGGRPLKFKSAAELGEKIEQYFSECEKTGEPLTVTGLALALDTTSRHLHQKPPVETQETNRRKTTKDSCGGLFVLEKGRGNESFIRKSDSNTGR